ncbi:MAG: hypothetical protein FD167_21 [bacterium]|nr:MAG: hypothetical protein FD167_21 [bacterium]
MNIDIERTDFANLFWSLKIKAAILITKLKTKYQRKKLKLKT